jgi:hypothetical protein
LKDNQVKGNGVQRRSIDTMDAQEVQPKMQTRAEGSLLLVWACHSTASCSALMLATTIQLFV